MSLDIVEIRRIAASGKYNLIPIYKEIVADLETPVSAFLKIHREGYSFLFESVEGGEKQARYSFIGTQPHRILEANDSDPLIGVEKEMSRYRLMPVEGIPKFTGGAVGYVGYECMRYFEPTVPMAEKKALDIPESLWMFFRSLVVFDHVKHSLKIVSHIYLDKEEVSEQELRSMYDDALSRIEALARRLDGSLPILEPHQSSLKAGGPEEAVENGEAGTRPSFEGVSNHGRDGYMGMVASLKKDIVKGNIIQAVPSHRVARRTKVHPFNIYRQLRVVNPSPYMFYLDLQSFQVLGASPECLVKVQDGIVETHPIAGTRKRGKNEEEDERLAKELLASEKERAEHIMLVDLGRNDVGRVAVPGTVRVNSLMGIEKYSHVMHIVSKVSGQLSPDLTPYDALRAVFPAGTVTGAPKIKAMQLVAALEKEQRGVYAGAVGYVSYGGILDVCIAIRTMVFHNGVVYLQAGGGIVYDSVEEDEYVETVNKMKASGLAVDRAEAVANKLTTKPATPQREEDEPSGKRHRP